MAEQGQCLSEPFKDLRLSAIPGQTIIKTRIFLPTGYNMLTEAESSLQALIQSPSFLTRYLHMPCTGCHIPQNTPGQGAHRACRQSTCTVTDSSYSGGVWQRGMISQRTLHLSLCCAAQPDLASTKEAPAD